MDWNTLYEQALPYLGPSGIAVVALLCLYVFIKVRSILNKAESKVNSAVASMLSRWENSDNESIKAFKEALPEDFTLNVEALTEKKLSEAKNYIIDGITDCVVKPITENTELVNCMAKIMMSSRILPDTDKEELARLLKLEDAKTVENLKVELVPKLETKNIAVEKSVVKTQNVLID